MRYSSLDIHIGLKIKEIRKARKITQSKLGRVIFVSFQQIQKYEHGKSKITVSQLYSISKFLNVSIDYFYQDYIEYRDIPKINDYDVYQYIFLKLSNLNLEKQYLILDFMKNIVSNKYI